MDLDTSYADTRKHAKTRWREERSRLEDDRTCVNVFTRTPDVLSWHDRPIDQNGPAFARLCELDHANSVNTIGHRGTSHDSDRLTRPDERGGTVTGHRRVEHLKDRGYAFRVSRPQCVSVHCRVLERWYPLGCYDNFGKHITQRFSNRQTDRSERCLSRKYTPLHLLKRSQVSHSVHHPAFDTLR
jgi:hypothetical protein